MLALFAIFCVSDDQNIELLRADAPCDAGLGFQPGSSWPYCRCQEGRYLSARGDQCLAEDVCPE